MTSRLIGRQAVVIGAGMAGLPAARVLADYFEHVTVLERDSLPQDTCHRSGTPQSKHVHGLLGGGQRALGNLFPKATGRAGQDQPARCRDTGSAVARHDGRGGRRRWKTS